MVEKIKIHGLKSAVGDYRRANHGGWMSPWYGNLMFDKVSGELWTDEFYNLGGNEWKIYHDSNVINLGALMGSYGIKVTMKNVKMFVLEHFS